MTQQQHEEQMAAAESKLQQAIADSEAAKVLAEERIAHEKKTREKLEAEAARRHKSM